MNPKKKLALKYYAILDAIVVAIIAICFAFFGKLVEATWFEEIAKWVVMTIGIVGVVDVIAYAVIGTIVSRKVAGLDGGLKEEEKKHEKHKTLI